VAGRHHAGMKHSGQGDSQVHWVFPVTLSGIPGDGIRRPDHLVLAHRFGRGSPVTVNPSSPAKPLPSGEDGSTFARMPELEFLDRVAALDECRN